MEFGAASDFGVILSWMDLFYSELLKKLQKMHALEI
jgi:hypothetical protein